MKKTSSIILSASMCLVGAVSTRASIWQNDGWSLTASSDVFAGYDSNLNLTQVSQGTSFAGAKPSLLLSRRNSISKIDGTFQAQETVYSSKAFPSQTDYFTSLAFAYPNIDDRLPRATASVDWQRATVVDPWASARVKLETLNVRGSARLLYTGKLGLNAEVAGYQSKYLSINNNQNNSGDVAIGLGYEKTPLTVYSLNVGYGHAESKDGRDLRPKGKSDSVSLFAKLDGELLPKLKGTVRLGFSEAEYSGAFSGSHRSPSVGVKFVWAATSRGNVSLDGSIQSGFAAEGQRAERRGIAATWEQVVFEEWSGFIGARIFDNRTYREALDRTEKGWDWRTGVAYDPSRRFRAQLSVEGTDQSSENLLFDYGRFVVKFTANVRF